MLQVESNNHWLGPNNHGKIQVQPPFVASRGVVDVSVLDQERTVIKWYTSGFCLQYLLARSWRR